MIQKPNETHPFSRQDPDIIGAPHPRQIHLERHLPSSVFSQFCKRFDGQKKIMDRNDNDGEKPNPPLCPEYMENRACRIGHGNI
jgi:hypothetical protein